MGLGIYIFPVDGLSKQKSMMRQGIRKACELKSRHYAACMVGIN